MQLPVDSLLPEIVASLRSAPNLVLEAPPGAGKTTRVPPALLAAGFSEILVLEPRRLAARLAARRVAVERGEPLGRTVGYHVRHDSIASEHTRIRFLTEGVLTRRLLSDPQLSAAGCVILDEFHERHLEGDFALALLRRLQQTTRPDLRLVVMSATLQGESVAAYLGGCPLLRSDGRLFPLDIRHRPADSAPLEQQVAAACADLLREPNPGSILVFLPGAAEIRRAQQACAPLATRLGLEVLPLHGDLSPEEQDRAVTPGPRPRIILSTNVAESSLTIEDVRAVVDSGLARVAQDSPWSGLPQVLIARISQASARQRAGRAGRLGPGTVIRLYPQEDFLRRPLADSPEIARRELSQLCLELHAAGIDHASDLSWLHPPPPETWNAAEDLLHRLGALDPHASITPAGRRMAALPLHPRLARLLLSAGKDGPALAALLSSGARLPQTPPHDSNSDLLTLLELPRDPYARRLEQQFRRAAGGLEEATEDVLRRAVLQAFPDRVARRRRGEELRLANGASALLARNTTVRTAEFLVCVEIEERPEQGLPLVRLASAIEPGWLLDLFPDRVRSEETLEWNKTAERVETRSALLYDGLVLDESRGHRPDPEAAAALLTQKILEAGWERLARLEESQAFDARLAFASAHSDLQPLTGERLRAALERYCYGRRACSELGGDLFDSLLTPAERRLLDEVAPARIRLPSGRETKVHYASGQTPWVASRLQDFFGLKETPRIARGRVPLVVHLLAPSQRPVQTTTDLAGFWQRLYPALRRELSRRYPKHKWPENP